MNKYTNKGNKLEKENAIQHKKDIKEAKELDIALGLFIKTNPELEEFREYLRTTSKKFTEEHHKAMEDNGRGYGFSSYNLNVGRFSVNVSMRMRGVYPYQTGEQEIASSFYMISLDTSSSLEHQTLEEVLDKFVEVIENSIYE